MYTLRIRGVPKGTTVEEISNAIGSNKGVYLARTESSADSSRTATVTLPDKKAAQRILNLETLLIQKKKVLVDDSFSGLTVLSSGFNPVIE